MPILRHDQDEVCEFKLHPPDPIGFMEPIDYSNRRRMPSSAIPLSAVLQVSPEFTGRARVSVPVVTISPAASGRIDFVACQQADEMAQRRNGPVENVRGVAGVHHAPVAKKIDRKGGKRSLPFQNVRSERMSHPDQQRAMEAVGGDSISGGKLPSGKID